MPRNRKHKEANVRPADYRRPYNLSSMTDEEIQNMWNSISSASSESEADNGDFDDDDSLADPDFNLSAEDFPKIELQVAQSERNTSAEILTNDLNMSLDIPPDELLSLAPTFEENQREQHKQPVEVESQPRTSSVQPDIEQQAQARPLTIQPATVIQLSKKPAKRPRSPLPVFEECGPSMQPNNGGFIGSSADIDLKSTEFSKITWRKTNLVLHRNEIVFRGDSKLPESFNDLKTPYSCFNYFFSDELFEKIAEETNMKASQQDIQTKFSVNFVDIKKYIGILVYMSIYRYPSLERYWGQHSFEAIRNTMTSKRFYEIRRYLCFNNINLRKKNGEDGYDSLFKIRPVVDHLNHRFDSIPKNPRLCVDEQMCGTKMKSRFRQYMPNKPHKWGIKLFVLCDSYGFSYKFEIYTGSGDNVVLPNTPNLGACANIVVRLSQSIPDFKYHILYFDNFYTSLPLLVYLRSRGIYSLGTIRASRINNCKLPGDRDKELQREPRGYSVEYVGRACGIDLTVVLWKDTKNVKLASTYVGIIPFKSAVEPQPIKATRYDRSKKNYLEVDCPNIIKEYNYHMGGVDLMDGLLGRYHIRLKTSSYSLRLFYHLIDMTIVNAYLLHRRIHGGFTSYELADFRSEIADVLCRFQQQQQKKGVGRPSQSAQKTMTECAASAKKTYAPPRDIRFDGFGHWPDMLDRTGKKLCKLPGCKSETQMFCVKCKLNLCLTPAKKCFQIFHDIV